jgi:hypothetical protein
VKKLLIDDHVEDGEDGVENFDDDDDDNYNDNATKNNTF